MYPHGDVKGLRYGPDLVARALALKIKKKQFLADHFIGWSTIDGPDKLAIAFRHTLACRSLADPYG